MSCPEGALEPSPSDSYRRLLALEGRPEPLDKLHGSQAAGPSTACSQLPPTFATCVLRRLVLEISVTVLTREEGYGTLTIIILKRKITIIRKNVEKLETSSIMMGIQFASVENSVGSSTVKHRIIL